MKQTRSRILKILRTIVVAPFVIALFGCAPEVGSDRWCKSLEETPKTDWSASDAAAFTKHCVLGLKPDN